MHPLHDWTATLAELVENRPQTCATATLMHWHRVQLHRFSCYFLLINPRQGQYRDLALGFFLVIVEKRH